MPSSRKARELQSPESGVSFIGKGFGKYRPEEESSIRHADVSQNPAVGRLKSAFDGLQSRTAKDDAMMEMQCIFPYSDALEIAKGLEYCAQDVAAFSIALKEFESQAMFPEIFRQKAGIFLSALINNGPDLDYLVYTDHLDRQISHFGFRNNKLVAVEGSLGEHSACMMEGGRLEVHGNVGQYFAFGMSGGVAEAEEAFGQNVGCRMKGGTLRLGSASKAQYLGRNMEGGLIYVSGDTDEYAGIDMKGGRLFIEGNAGCRVGAGMEGGRILVRGSADAKPGMSMKGGIILIKGDASDPGYMMEGGTIIIKGDIPDLRGPDGDTPLEHNIRFGINTGGKIIHKGVVLFNKPPVSEKG